MNRRTSQNQRKIRIPTVLRRQPISANGVEQDIKSLRSAIGYNELLRHPRGHTQRG